MAKEGSGYKGVFPYAMDMLEGSVPVAVHVGSGDDKKVWHLPEKLLKSKSTFFTAALESGFAEGISRDITLPQEDPDHFEYFVQWLYVGLDLSGPFEPDLLVPLWVLGDRLGCPLMQNSAMCKLIEYYEDPHIAEVIEQIFEESAPGSKLRQFAVDQCLFDVRKCVAPAYENGWSLIRFVKDNEDFAQQLAEATVLLGREEPKNPYYHQSPYLCAPLSCKSPPRSGR